jgi:hypothetical protein
VNARWTPIGELGLYSASRTRPATIVGSANGRSMTLFTIDRPGKRSRTSTQAVIVPKTALTSAARTATITLSFSAATASGFDTADQKPDQPSSPDAATTAARGSTTISVR